MIVRRNKMEIETLKDLTEYCKKENKYIDRIIRDSSKIIIIQLGDNK